MKKETSKAIELDDSMLDTVIGGAGIMKTDGSEPYYATSVPGGGSSSNSEQTKLGKTSTDGVHNLQQYATVYGSTVTKIALVNLLPNDPNYVPKAGLTLWY